MNTPNKELINKCFNLVSEAELELKRELERLDIRKTLDQPTTKKVILIGNYIYTAKRNLSHALDEINKMEV
jgi:hypothetical protein